jgi:CheY-like chemotaxis protein
LTSIVNFETGLFAFATFNKLTVNHNKTCFLIDDDTDDHEIFILALMDIDKSIRCVTANDGQMALNKIRQDEKFIPDYIFMDLNMPRMNGRQCLVEINKIPRLRNVPVFIYSTSSAPNDVIETKNLGAAGFISKPSTIDELTEMLVGIFEKTKK